MRAPFPALVLVLSVVACTAWPPPGSGGFADAEPVPPLAPGDDPALRNRLVCGLARFGELERAARNEGRLAGRVELTRRIAARAQHEYAGGLRGDAAATLDQLDLDLDAFRAGSSVPPGIAYAAGRQLPPGCR